MASTTRKIAEGTLIFFTRKIWISLFGGLATLLIIRALGIYHYGILTLALSIVAILSPFLDFDISTVMCADMANELGKNQLGKVKRYIKDYVKLELFLGIFYCLIMIIGFNFFAQKYNNEIISIVKITIALLFIQSIKNILATVFYGFSNFRYFTLTDVIESLIKFILVILLYYFWQINLINVSYVILISTILPLFITIPLFFKLIKPLKNVVADGEPLLKKIIFQHGKFHIINQPLKSALEGFRLWIIKFFVGVEGVAIFQVANKLFGYLNIFFSSFEGVLLPILANEISKNIDLAREMVKKSIKYLTYFGFISMIISFIFMEKILHLLFLSKYDASLPVLYWFLITFPIVGFSVIIRPLFFAFKGQKYLMQTFFYANLIGFPLGILFTYKFGVIGFAIPIGVYLTVLIRYYYIKKLDHNFYIKFTDFFRYDYYDKVLVNKILRRLKLIKN